MPATASSSTSSRTSASSCTSESPVRRNGTRSSGLRVARLVHPFPSILDGLATGAIAYLAGGGAATGVRLGLAMVFLQFAIGAANDVADAAIDSGRLEKPVASGMVATRTAIGIAVASAVLGLALAAPSGAGVLAIALGGLAVGIAYDVRLKRTPLAWLPLSVGIPLLLLFAWSGAGADLGPEVAIVLPAGALAGAALALGNGLVDPAADAGAGVVTPVVLLGTTTASRLAVGLVVVTVALAAGSLIQLGAGFPFAAAATASGVLAVAALAAVGHPDRGIRERAWEVEAVGIALLGVAWVAGLAASRV